MIYGVHILDSAPGADVRVEVAGNLARARHRATHWRNMGKQRRLYGIGVTVVQRPDETFPWTPVDNAGSVIQP